MTDADAPITRKTLLDVRLAEVKNTHRIEVRRIQIKPGHAAGAHLHNGPVIGSIEAGSVWFQVDGEPESLLRSGDVFFEPEATRIVRFDAGKDGVTFLGYFLLDVGQEPELTFTDA